MADGKKRSPWIWVAAAGGGACALCSLGTLAVVALGAMGDETPSASTQATATGGAWIPAGEVARGTALTQKLPGGRWLAQNGSQLETEKARTANSVLVQTNASGRLHELRFDDDGSYEWQWVHSSNFPRPNRSSADEKGQWSLDGVTLTLTPTSQTARYTNGDQAQDKEDIDLTQRRYQVVDITLQTVPNTGAPMKQFPGVELSGPNGAWDIEHGGVSLDLQRL